MLKRWNFLKTGFYEGIKLLNRILRGRSDANIPFAELCRLMGALGFNERIRGSHHIFAAEGVEEILNLLAQRWPS